MLIFVVSIPTLLCVKPIVLGCCGAKHNENDDNFKTIEAVELTNQISASGMSEDAQNQMIAARPS
jgi:hypothetical protein